MTINRCGILLVLFLGLLAVSVAAHDLFLKFDSYFLPVNAKATVRLLNGTFRSSENAVARERFQDVSLLAPEGTRTHPANEAWRDEGNTSLLDLETGAAGTYLVGVATKPREIALKAKDFNAYLVEDGLPETLAERRRQGELRRDARERYSKYVKALFQVGDTTTDTYQNPLGYAVELVPQQNPYRLKAGDTLALRCLAAGQPLAGQTVQAGYETARGRLRRWQVRADKDGVVRIKLAGAGRWYVKFIYMRRAAEPNLDYESQWASLTFSIK